MTLSRNLLLLIIAVVCFLIGLLMGVGWVGQSHEQAWLFGGLAAFAASHLP